MALDFRTLVKSGKELIGIFIKTPNYQLVEIVSSCDLSFIVLDAIQCTRYCLHLVVLVINHD